MIDKKDQSPDQKKAEQKEQALARMTSPDQKTAGTQELGAADLAGRKADMRKEAGPSGLPEPKSSEPDMVDVENEDPLIKLITSTKSPVVSDWVRLGVSVSVGFFAVLILWSIFAPLSTGAVVSGRVIVAGERDVIEHLEGGIVKSILVSSGEQVQAGQVLVELDPSAGQARLRDVQSRLYAQYMRRARLEAEWQLSSQPDFTNVRTDGISPAVRETITRLEESQFAERLSLYRAQEVAALNGISAEKEVLDKQQDMQGNVSRQIDLIEEEIGGVEDLLEKGFASKTRLLALKRQRESLLSRELELESALVSQIGRVERAEIALRELRTARRQEVAELLGETHLAVESEIARLNLVADQLTRTSVTAPHGGIVMDLRVNTRGEVVEPGGALLDLVPEDARLVVSGRLQAADAANIYPGLPVQMSVAAFKGRNSPRLRGEVLLVAPDVLVDERSGEVFYDVSIGFTDASLASLGAEQKLQPGFPVEAIIETDAQPVMVYLVAPILETVRKAFIEP